jgi:ribosome biogenesis GTPase
LVQGLDNNFNFNRLERYLTMVRDGNVEPVIVFNKTDAADNLDSLMGLARDRFKNTKTFFVSAKTDEGMKNIKNAIRAGETVVFLGSSGVGKSTIINRLSETILQATGEVREKDSKGRHTTSRREMFILPAISAESGRERGGIVIDTPGMRELQVLVSQESVDDVFEDFEKLGKGCRFTDCDHETSKDCAILAKLKTGEIVSERYKSFLKLRREARFIGSKGDPEQERAKRSFWKKVNKSLKTRGKSEE